MVLFYLLFFGGKKKKFAILRLII